MLLNTKGLLDLTLHIVLNKKTQCLPKKRQKPDIMDLHLESLTLNIMT